MAKQTSFTREHGNITLRLKHFRYSTIKYVLEQTGYSSITEYEDLCYNTDKFPIEITLNGYIHSNCPQLDYKLYRAFSLSIHHLFKDVRKHLLVKYLGMTQIEYELLHDNKNVFQIWVPYKDETVRRSFSTPIENCWAPGAPDVVCERVEEDDTDGMVEAAKPLDLPLKKWQFKLNQATKNSYILTPPQSVQTVKSGKAGWGDNNWTPTSWHAPIEGLARPVYYNNATGGWIISLRFRLQLLDAGANEQK